jgi:hypothetical protein
MQEFFGAKNFDLVTPYEHMVLPPPTGISKSSNISSNRGKPQITAA